MVARWLMDASGEERPDAVRVFGFIQAEKANFLIKFIRERLGVTRESF